ncbi:MAG: hypothetical protein Kow0099_22580 [Candidatus Abyssubacteria bacterium]
MIRLQQHVYDGLDLLAEVSAVGQLQAGYTHGPGIDDPLIARYNNANYYYHKNHQGSVTEITSGNQSIVKTYEYDAYGNILQETGPSLTGGFTYTARELHTRSGLYYYRARFYDPRTGRFLMQDPIGFLGGLNLYAYVAVDPVNLVDPLGLVWGQGGPPIRFTGHGFEPARPAIQDVLGPGNWSFFVDFLFGLGDTYRDYDPCSPETSEMASSPGADALRDFYRMGGGPAFQYTTGRAFSDTVGNTQSITFQVGGFTGTATDNLDGTVTYTIHNPAGTHSFFYHLVPDRSGTTGPMRTIHQTFTWTEPSECPCESAK